MSNHKNRETIVNTIWLFMLFMFTNKTFSAHSSTNLSNLVIIFDLKTSLKKFAVILPQNWCNSCFAVYFGFCSYNLWIHSCESKAGHHYTYFHIWMSTVFEMFSRSREAICLGMVREYFADIKKFSHREKNNHAKEGWAAFRWHDACIYLCCTLWIAGVSRKQEATKDSDQFQEVRQYTVDLLSC